MAVKLTSTREAAKSNGLKILVHGQPGTGKTCLCATTDEPTLIISAESGLLSLRNTDIPVIEVKSIDDVADAYRFISETAEGQAFRWVCLDSISEIGEVCLSAEKAKTKDPRQAYGALSDAMQSMIRAFRDLPGKNVYFSCKQEREKDESTGSILYSPSLPGRKLGQGVGYFFDFVFALRVEKDAEGIPYRVLQTSRDFNYEAKDRSGVLAAFEPPNLAAIAAKIHQN